MHLKATGEGLCDPSELGKAEDKLVGDVADGDLFPDVRGRGLVMSEQGRAKERRTLPVKGTMWCSQREKTSMSRTMTISSWSSAKMALPMTSEK